MSAVLCCPAASHSATRVGAPKPSSPSSDSNGRDARDPLTTMQCYLVDAAQRPGCQAERSAAAGRSGPLAAAAWSSAEVVDPGEPARPAAVSGRSGHAAT